MPIRLSKRAALMVIDVQDGLDEPIWGKRNNPNMEQNIAKLLDGWRKSGRPVIHVKHDSKLPHSPLRPRSPGNKIKDAVRPVKGEPVVSKRVNSAFIGTSLERDLRRRRIHTLIMTGLVTDHCVSTTARMAGNLGFDTIVVSDATATFDRVGHDGKKYAAEEIHNTALASLKDEFAQILETETILDNL
ncbi:MAG TPA: cysteine hydrolase family protein [Nitrososphaerales archaeon]|nr:cysteine hydrolase family protein [Nitrososphaerales archaeon]